MTDLPRPGDLRERVRLEIPVDTPDGSGGVTRSYQEAWSAWAQILPQGAGAHTAAARAGELRRFEVRLRRPPSPPARGMRLIWKSRRLAIETVSPLDAGERFLRLDCLEET